MTIFSIKVSIGGNIGVTYIILCVFLNIYLPISENSKMFAFPIKFMCTFLDLNIF